MTPAKRILFSALTILFLLSACAPAPAPTQDPAEIQRQIEQSVALTVSAQNALTEAARPVVPEATNTPLPTQTEPAPASPTPLIPTATSFVIVPPTSTVSSSGGGGRVTLKPDYACDAINREPRDNTIFKPGYTFNIKWTIVNTGAKAWPAGMDLRYFSGPQLTSTTIVELPAMAPGDKHEVTLTALAPSTYGFYVMTWTMEGNLCYPYVAFYVE
jgi:hypothetical protein